MLAWSDLLLVSRFGWLMAALIAAALLADILLTPALLAGPVGLLMERRLRRLKAAAAGTKEETQHFSEEEFTPREISGSASQSISR
jgi:hypothetical protein